MKLYFFSRTIFFVFACGYISVNFCAVDVSKNMKVDSAEKAVEEEEIPFTEDLMREHGILNRVLLIYEEVIRRMGRGDCPVSQLSKALDIIKGFIENYHEKIEEEYVFPLFEKKKKQVALVKTLRKQHASGRVITNQVIEILKSDISQNKKAQKHVISLLKKFIKMYRPHEAREDTVLFPEVRSLINKKELEELSDKFEEIEHEFFGKEGFFGIVKKVEDIEKELGIYNLEQFTPSLK